MRITFECLTCGKIVTDYPHNKSRYCSSGCYHQSRLGKPTWNKGIKGLFHHSEKHKRYMSKKLSGRKVFANSGSFKKGEVRISGKNSHLWKGGITPLNMQIRSSSVYKEWRKSVFKRDNFTCQHCGRVGGPLHADHIKPFAYLIQQVKDIYGKIVYEQIEEYSELWEIKNGRTLCLECHKKTKSYLNRHYVSNLCQNPK